MIYSVQYYNREQLWTKSPCWVPEGLNNVNCSDRLNTIVLNNCIVTIQCKYNIEYQVLDKIKNVKLRKIYTLWILMDTMYIQYKYTIQYNVLNQNNYNRSRKLLESFHSYCNSYSINRSIYYSEIYRPTMKKIINN